jgi:hypothetical protein
VNDDGWFVTAGHILELIVNLNAETTAARDHEREVARIRADTTLSPKDRSKQLSALGRPKDDSTDRFCVFWGQFPGAQLFDVAILHDVDLGIGRLDPFNKNVVRQYPTFKDPSKDFEPGTSLCKLGFPFHVITPSYDSATDQFNLPANTMAFFPIEGIFTRTEIKAQAGQPPANYRRMRVETSSPGLKGQSGGPIFDTKGTIWAIQCVTQHLALGFDPLVPGSKTGEKEHQFLNTGLGVHAETILGLFNERGVTKVQMSTY